MNQTRKPVTGVAANASTCVPILLIKLHAQGHMKRLEAEASEIIPQSLHSRLVANWWVGVWATGGWFGGVHSALAVDLVEMLGLQVVGFKVLVGDSPCWRDPTVMTDFAEIFFTQSEQGSTVKLGVSTHVVVCVGMEGLATDVLPHLLGVVMTLNVDNTRIPVGFLARYVIASLQKQDLLAGSSQSVA